MIGSGLRIVSLSSVFLAISAAGLFASVLPSTFFSGFSPSTNGNGVLARTTLIADNSAVPGSGRTLGFQGRSIADQAGGTTPQTITGFASIGTQTYGAVFSITGVTATSSLPVTFTSTTSACTVSGNTVTVVSGNGSCSITASQAGNGTYAAAPNVTQSFSTGKAPLSVVVHSATKAYGAGLPGLTGTVTGLVNGDTLGGTITVSYSTTATSASAVGGGTGASGAYPITALVGGSAIGNYALTDTPGLLTITPVPLTVTVTPQSKVYGAPLPFFTANLSGLVNNGDPVGGTITVGFSSVALAGSPVGGGSGAGGGYLINATVTGSAIGNYTVTVVTGILTVTPATLTVTANNESMSSGAAVPPLSATITGFVNGDTSAVVRGAPILATTATAASAPGNYPITVTAGTLAAANYSFRFVNGTLSVSAPASQIANISVVSGSGQSAIPGTAFAAPLIALVTNSSGSPVSNAQVVFSVSAGPASVSPQVVLTGSDGTAQTSATPTGTGAITILATTSNPFIAAAAFNETGLTSSSSSFPLSLSLSALPSTLAFTVVQGGDNPLPASIAVSNTNTGVLQWTASDTGNPTWLALGAASGITPAVLSVSINTTGLAAGTYESTITVTSGTQQETVPVTLTVVAPVPAQFALTPAAIVVNAVAGSTIPITRVIDIGNGGTGSLPWTATPATGNAWLTVSPSSGSSLSGSPPSTLTVQLNPSGLAAGQYLANIAFSSPGVAPANLPVVLNLAAQANLTSSVPLLEFRGITGSSFAAQQLPIPGSGISFTATPSVTAGENWLTLSGATGVAPASISVSVNAAGLAAGVYVGYVSVQSTSASNTLVVPVVLDLASPAAVGILSASPGGVLFSGPASATPGSPLTQSIAISSDAGSLSWSATAIITGGGTWLTVSPSTGTGNGSITLSANLTGLQPGTYSAQVAIGGGGTGNILLIVPVTMIVSGTTTITSATTLQPIQPAGDFIANLDVPIPLQVSILSPAGAPVLGATVQVAFTTGDLPVTLTDAGGGTYTGYWTPMQSGPVSLIFTSPGLTPGVVTGYVSTAAGTLPAFTAGGVVGPVNFVSGVPLGVGSIATLFGQNLAAQTAPEAGYPLPLTLGGASVTINGVPAPLFYASPGQINFFLPEELAGQTSATFVVSTAAGVAEVTGVPITPESPDLFLTDTAGDVAAVHLNGQVVNAAAPVAAGEIIEIYATGLGPVSNAPADGAAAAANPLAYDQAATVVNIGGVNAQVMYAGLAPGFAGLYQLNVVVPAGLPSGPNWLTVAAGPLFGNTAILQIH